MMKPDPPANNDRGRGTKGIMGNFTTNLPELRTSDRIEPGDYELFLASMEQWPISPASFQSVSVKRNIRASLQGEPAGFVWIDKNDDTGCIQLIVVKPEYRNIGIGRLLLSNAEAWLSEEGVRDIRLGAGDGYLWQGVPDGLQDWFLRRGYSIDETSIDMIQDLRTFEYPEEVDRRLPAGIAFRNARPDDYDALMAALEDEDLVDWKPYYRILIDAGRYRDIFVALENGEITGMVMGSCNETIWQERMEKPVGELACMGVVRACRGRGIGKALAARVTLDLQQRGMVTGYLRWTSLEDWYGSLGYRRWAAFLMMSKQLR